MKGRYAAPTSRSENDLIPLAAYLAARVDAYPDHRSIHLATNENRYRLDQMNVFCGGRSARGFFGEQELFDGGNANDQNTVLIFAVK